MSIHSGRRELRSSMDGSINPRRLPRIHGHGKKVSTLPNGHRPINPADRPNPEEEGLPWRMLEDLDTSMDLFYPEIPEMEECPVEKSDHLETEQQKLCMRWIEKILDLDRRITKDPRLYCAYCDMNNHPRFSCKHAYKHKNPDARHRCTLRAGRHPPFLCPKAQVNGGDGPNWYKVEYKLPKEESREPDYRWGENVSHVDVDPPTQGSQRPAADPQPQCAAAAAMMHGVSRPAALQNIKSSGLQFHRSM